MKRFVLTTKSESSDYYIYFIEHETEPSNNELKLFLEVNANDIEDGIVFEHVQKIVEIPSSKTLTKFREIPKNII